MVMVLLPTITTSINTITTITTALPITTHTHTHKPLVGPCSTHTISGCLSYDLAHITFSAKGLKVPLPACVGPGLVHTRTLAHHVSLADDRSNTHKTITTIASTGPGD